MGGRRKTWLPLHSEVPGETRFRSASGVAVLSSRCALRLAFAKCRRLQRVSPGTSLCRGSQALRLAVMVLTLRVII